MFSLLAEYLHHTFATDQNYHAQQQQDGSYRKKNGAVTKTLIEKTLTNEGSIAIYQKNNDFSLNWICFDFDISKENLGVATRAISQEHLDRTVKDFCSSLDTLGIPYLLEFSGNRGFHIWITFSESIHYQIGYDIQQAIIDSTKLRYDKSLISLDLFPKSAIPTGGIGLGVKVPLSKHKKSGLYATLLMSLDDISNPIKIETIDEQFASLQIRILKEHKKVTKLDIEKSLERFFVNNPSEEASATRIKKITIDSDNLEMTELLEHWANEKPLQQLKTKIETKKSLTNDERKILVGIIHNIYNRKNENIGKKILTDIFKQQENYDQGRTNSAISKLSSYNFPPQEIIENCTEKTFSRTMTVTELLKECIPCYSSHVDSTLEITEQDVEITRIAEINYLFLNDEAQSHLTLQELACRDTDKLIQLVKSTIQSPKMATYFVHERAETNKVRKLISLKTSGRLTTSCILKKLSSLFSFQHSNSSHGYKISKGFSGGHIFQPWLYLWIKFVSNIRTAIEDPEYIDYYIVKTDIKSFYDSIPHDNLKRMLLGGANPRIDQKLSELNVEAKKAYIHYINVLMDIAELTNGANIGLPQGPAFARYLAELYLDNIDRIFDSMSSSEDIYLYQRYVDDIFIISDTESKAFSALENLKKELELLGLEINNEKTRITKIRHFSNDFESYRSQSKYAVDRVSRNFSESTITEQNLAVNEFIKLVQSDSCNDDLAFIFSHLAGVQQIDEFKRDKIKPTLESKTGRGSLYKHLFNFVLECPDNWRYLNDIHEYDTLQSEVLTACLISQLELNINNTDGLKLFITGIIPKLSKTELTEEHVAYLHMCHGIEIGSVDISSTAIIRCLKSSLSNDKVNVTSKLIQLLNTPLNDIKDLPSFIEAIYPLCASRHVTKNDLNSLASTFFAKMSNSMQIGDLSIDRPSDLYTPSIAQKYYYLLCLYSISNRNSSRDLIENAWKHLANIYNGDASEKFQTKDNWFEKIVDIEYSIKQTEWIISSIIDGNIFRGLDDKKQIFKQFHNLLLFFISYQDNTIDSTKIASMLDTLTTKGTYYKWLIDRTHSSIFPTNKRWFDLNIIENNTIILRNGKDILIRKPTQDFFESSNRVNEHNGYSEIIVEYRPETLQSFHKILAGKSLLEKLKSLSDAMIKFNDDDLHPNIFCNDPILKNTSLTTFNSELDNLPNLIVEKSNNTLMTLVNNRDNFIKSFFDLASERDDDFRYINEKYIKNLSQSIGYLDFIKHFINQINDISGSENKFYYDISAAAAIYLLLKESDAVKRVDEFLIQYHKFSKLAEERHIYAVDNKSEIADNNLVGFFNTIEYSLKVIPTRIIHSLTLYLYKDIEIYKETIYEMIAKIDSEEHAVKIEEFKKIRPIVSPIQETIHISGIDYKFNDIYLINLTTQTIHVFEPRHIHAITSSDHIYFYNSGILIYIIAIHSSLSIIYKSISDKMRLLGNRSCSYPDTMFDKRSIVSIENYSRAIDVVSVHNDITEANAEAIILNWLSSVPSKFHHPIITLIAAHRFMMVSDLDSFNSKVKELTGQKGNNPFLVKDIHDYNGTHRLLYRDKSLGRTIDSLSPSNIPEGSTTATIIVDNIISGSQVTKALRFYISEQETTTKEKYFRLTTEKKIKLKDIFKKLNKINICTVFYTQNALSRIRAELLALTANSELEVNIIHGTDISDDALFHTSRVIGEKDKSMLRNLLTDHATMKELYAHLDFKRPSKYTLDDINTMNLITRYKSMPKKIFTFLTAGTKHDKSSSPFTRVLEEHENKSIKK